MTMLTVNWGNALLITGVGFGLVFLVLVLLIFIVLRLCQYIADTVVTDIEYAAGADSSFTCAIEIATVNREGGACADIDDAAVGPGTTAGIATHTALPAPGAVSSLLAGAVTNRNMHTC